VTLDVIVTTTIRDFFETLKGVILGLLEPSLPLSSEATHVDHILICSAWIALSSPYKEQHLSGKNSNDYVEFILF